MQLGFVEILFSDTLVGNTVVTVFVAVCIIQLSVYLVYVEAEILVCQGVIRRGIEISAIVCNVGIRSCCAVACRKLK